MNLNDLTIIVAVDKEYLRKFNVVFDTWMRHKKDMKGCKLMLVYDDNMIGKATSKEEFIEQCFVTEEGRTLFVTAIALGLTGLTKLSLVPWSMPNAANQREKMLTGLVFAAAENITTPWYVKIDADTIATNPDKWIDDSWFKPVNGMSPAFISNPWGYTKPVDAIDRLEAWSKTVPELADLPPVGPFTKGNTKVFHDRIISWLFFGNTEWTKKCVSFLTEKRLPVPSQDTFLWYCAEKMKQPYHRVSFKKRGWDHLGRKPLEHIQQRCKEVMT